MRRKSNRCRFEIYKAILEACRFKPLSRYRIWIIVASSSEKTYAYIKLLKKQKLLSEEVETRGKTLKKLYRTTEKGIEFINDVNKIKNLLGEAI